MRRLSWAGVALACALVSGCTGEPVKVGPRPPMTPTLLGSAGGSGCGFLLFNFIPMGVNERAHEANAKAQAAVGSPDVVDVKIRESWYIVPLVGTILCTDIEETAVR